MRLWDEVVAVALLGTERRRLDGDGQDADGTLLDEVAVGAIARDAGYKPAREREPLPAPAPQETLPRVTEAAAGHLRDILAGGYRLVLDEWLQRAAAAGWRAPEELLPALLDLRRDDALPVLGERGAWLAERNPAWRWARPLDGAGEQWRTGTSAERRVLLRRLRRQEPARARALLTATWDAESGPDRAALLRALAANLSADDEPLLKRALGDARQDVRAVAAELLAGIVTSRFAARMAQCLRVTPPLRVEVVETPDVALLGPVPPGRGAGGWVLEQLAGAAPLALWTAATGAPPEELVRRALDSEHRPALLAGWAVAARRQRHEGWALTLLDAGAAPPALLAAVGPGRASAWLAERVTRSALTAATMALLDACPAPWSAELSAAVVERLPDAAVARAALTRLGTRLDPGVLDSAHARLDEGRFGLVLDLLRFRADICKELR